MAVKLCLKYLPYIKKLHKVVPELSFFLQGAMMDNAAVDQSELILMGLLLAVHRAEDGTYIFSPTGPFGNSYLLNDEQLPTVERWLIDVDINLAKKDLSPLTKIVSWGGTIAVGIGFAAFLGYIDIPIAVVVAGPLAALVILINVRDARAETPEMMKTFPFPEAQIAKLSYLDWLKKFVLTLSAMTIIKWMSWGFVGVSILTMFLVVVTFGLGAIFGAWDGVDHIALIGWIIILLAANLLLPLLCLPFIMARRNFKKHTGRTLTLKNLYLQEMRQLNSTDQMG